MVVVVLLWHSYGGGAAKVRVLDEETGLERETSNSLAAYSDETRQELQSAQVGGRSWQTCWLELRVTHPWPE